MNQVLQQPTLYDRIDKIVVTALKWLSYVSAVFLVAIMFIAFFNVVGEKLRKIGVSFASGIKSSTEIIQYFHIPLVFLSAAYVTLDHGHTSIDLVTSHFPIKVRRGLRAFGYLLGAAVSGGTVSILSDDDISHWWNTYMGVMYEDALARGENLGNTDEIVTVFEAAMEYTGYEAE